MVPQQPRLFLCRSKPGANFGHALLACALVLVVAGCRNDKTAGQAEASDAAAPAAALPYQATREAVTRRARGLLESDEITGISLALVDGGEVVWATGFGMADIEHGRAAGPGTIYNVGSVTKPITAAAVLQAVEADELGLDQTLAVLLPELELADDAEQRISLAQLLTHQSGLPSDWFVHSLSDQAPPVGEIVGEIAGLALADAPGVHTIYSNLGMSLAGLALARATGTPYEQRVTEALLRPAGMATAHFAHGPAPAGSVELELAGSYRRGKQRHDPEFRMAPAGGLRASVLDLASFARLILGRGTIDGRRLLSPASVDAMLTAHNDALALDFDHGIGYAWFLDNVGLDWAGPVAWHGGRTYYHHAQLVILPEHGLAVAIASNSQTAGPAIEGLAIETLELALHEKFGLERPLAPSFDDLEPEDIESPPALLEAFAERHVGDYATSIGISHVRVRDGEVWSTNRITSSSLSLLDGDSGMTESVPDARVHFIDEAGYHLMALERGGKTRASGVRLPPPAPLSPAWRAREGRWTLVGRAGEATTISAPELRVVNGRLQLEYLSLLELPPLIVTLALEPLDDRRARILGLARGQGVIVEVRGEGDDEHLWWLGREFYK